MPVLNLTGNAHQDARLVLITMAYPENEERRNQLFAQFRVSEATEGSIPLSDAKLLLNAIPFNDMFGKSNNGYYSIDGWNAGNILLYMAIMESNGVRASKRKALDLLKMRLFLGRTYEGKGVKYSRKSLEDYWYKFRSVAHLWTAWNCFLTEDQSQIEGDWSPFMDERKPLQEAFRCFSEDSLPEFLALAEWFREFGENHKPEKQRHGTTLRPEESWRVSPTCPLPGLRISLVMPQWMRDALSGYKAHS